MISKLRNIRNTLEQRKGVKDKLEQDLKASGRDLKRQQLKLKQIEKSLEISKQVGLKTQQELEYHISNLVTAALASVFSDCPYTFRVNFIERRGKTECDLRLERNGELIEAISAAGGGVVDITSLALRIAALSMQTGHVRPILLLDEPFKHLSINLQEQAEQMLHELAGRIGIQIITNSHASSAMENTDAGFQMSIKNSISKMEKIQYSKIENPNEYRQ